MTSGRTRGDARVAIVGAGVGGLATAVALARDGHGVVVCERDSPGDVSDGSPWLRPGTTQERHSHAFLGRLRVLLLERHPELLEALKHAGATELGFDRVASEMRVAPEIEAGDDEVALLACRRTTFEATLRAYASRDPRIEIRDGVDIVGVQATAAGRGPPRITALRMRRKDGSSERLEADLIVDASGRGSHVDTWLAELGIEALRQEREPCGIFYASRFYRMLGCSGAPSFPGGVMAVDLGYLKAGLFPGDDGTFSLTLAAAPEDSALRAVLDETGFEIAARALPRVAPFVDPERSHPLSRVHGMGGLENARRFALREDGEPAVLGLALVGDSALHTNPLYGRGCALAFVHAHALADALAEAPEVGRAFALALEERVERELVPWYESSRVQDREARRVAAMIAAGEDPFAEKRADGSVDPRGYMRSLVRDGLGPALREDVALLRAFLRVFNLLDAPQDLMKNPMVLQRVLASYAKRAQRPAVSLGPDRARMVELLAAEKSLVMRTGQA